MRVVLLSVLVMLIALTYSDASKSKAIKELLESISSKGFSKLNIASMQKLKNEMVEKHGAEIAVRYFKVIDDLKTGGLSFIKISKDSPYKFISLMEQTPRSARHSVLRQFERFPKLGNKLEEVGKPAIDTLAKNAADGAVIVNRLSKDWVDVAGKLNKEGISKLAKWSNKFGELSKEQAPKVLKALNEFPERFFSLLENHPKATFMLLSSVTIVQIAESAISNADMTQVFETAGKQSSETVLEMGDKFYWPMAILIIFIPLLFFYRFFGFRNTSTIVKNTKDSDGVKQ